MTRTVADAALMLAAMAGPDEWDRTSLEGVPQDYVGSLGRGIEGLRVAFSPDLGGLPVDAEVATVVGQAVRAFDGLGCVVEEVKPGFADTHELIRCMWSTHEAGNFAQYLLERGKRMDPGLVACIRDGPRYGGVVGGGAPLGRAPAAARVRSRPAPSDSPCFERGRGPRVTALVQSATSRRVPRSHRHLRCRAVAPARVGQTSRP